jgi:phosphoserine phosphatase RsbU/P
VSRRHARCEQFGGTWFVIDLESRNGTFLNGQRVHPGERVPLRHGDHLRISPWIFRVVLRHEPGSGAESHTIDDADSAAALRLHAREMPPPQRVAPMTLRGLMNAVAEIHAAPDESTLWTALVSAAVRLSGFERGALLSFGSSVERVEPQAQLDTRSRSGVFEYSRTLLRAAQAGAPVHLRGRDSVPSAGSSSIESLGISSAVCVPLMLDGAVCRALYLDSRGRHAPNPEDAAGICQTLVEMASLALANLMRRDLDQRLASLQHDAELASEAQRLLLPPERGRVGAVEYAMCFRPGRIVSGDLFGVAALSDHRVGVYLGDVTGKGLRAGLVMAVIQGYLCAALQRRGDPAAALNDLAAHMASRLPDGCFASLWVGVIDPSRGELAIADAGHGMGVLAAGPRVELIRTPTGSWLGAAEAPYSATVLQLPPQARLVLISDGLAEQPGPDGSLFGLDRTLEVLATSATPGDDVAALAAAVEQFARTREFRDDLTIASLQVQG